MFDQKVGKIPEFTGDEPEQPEEVKPEEGKPQETLPAQEKPVEETKPTGEQEAVKPEGEGVVSEDTTEVAKQVQGLEAEKAKLLEDIMTLRGERRELKQKQVDTITTQIDELKDLHPEDVKVIERIAKAKGFLSKDDVKKILYEQTKQEVLNQFLDKHPEYKPENDPGDRNWNALNNQIRDWYKLPENPRRIMDVLEKARKDITPISHSEGDTAITKRQLKTASMGGGGTQPSSSSKSLTSEQREVYRRGGWTEEEIKDIEKRI